MRYPITSVGVVLGLACSSAARADYARMAPIEQYLMTDRSAEIALARSAAPDSVSRDAEVLVLTPRGYETAAKGGNGFVCLVERSWSDGSDDPEFWNPKARAPLCLNAPAARSYLPLTRRRTQLALAGRSKAQIFEALSAAVNRKELPTPEPGAMCFMMSKTGHLNDHDGHWRPHLMFFAPETAPAAWGAGLPGSPILAIASPEEHLTVFLVPVARWSDGTPSSQSDH